ncbi:phosphoribosylanthranilate isomerase [Flagellimonas algicola]|uniref:N-(5'-phosphoribosyl)anthranilate isomerase n=1 Tax=Flagellimonas algicola TaxID=2583815 RepID=A0ABY2WG14_9FLAO|nr:phosphoribosylanthranilate isomerase [Allomuricauda algicola]TMU50496.1 phosphoribosylanthranilate isomerase [Allomuricauda algicola]
MKLKVCGMKYNPTEVAQLQPDYLGFIFWEPSSRYFEGEIPELPKSIKKVGVFVDAEVEEVLEKVEAFRLDGVQLHGNENPNYCQELRHAVLGSTSHTNGIPKQVEDNQLSLRSQSRSGKNKVSTALDLTIIKVFSIKDSFDFSILKEYEDVCDYYLFDTKGKLPGGNGYAFDWSILKDYPSTKPYFLSGGIGLDSIEDLKEFLASSASNFCHAIDVNSKFEIEPGHKSIAQLKQFKKTLIDNPT